MTDEELDEYVIAATTLVLYHNNARPLECIAVLFPDSYNLYTQGRKSYIEKQLGYWHAGLNKFFAHLDRDRQRQYVKLAMERYLVEASTKVGR